MNKNEKIKVKFELDVNPPGLASYEAKYRLRPIPYRVLLYDKASLFSGKIHAVICRNWKNRVKGRDLYDHLFYLARDTKFNLPHLREKLIESGKIDAGSSLSVTDVKKLLNEKFQQIDYEAAKLDVIPFLDHMNSLDIWSSDFFCAVTDNLDAESEQSV